MKIFEKMQELATIDGWKGVLRKCRLVIFEHNILKNHIDSVATLIPEIYYFKNQRNMIYVIREIHIR